MSIGRMLRSTSLFATAAVGWLGVGLQLYLGMRYVANMGLPPVAGIVTTFSYFTVLTNLLVAVLLTASALCGRADTLLTRPGTMSAAAVYIVIVGAIYAVLLRAMWHPTGLQRLADLTLHDAMPVLYVLCWLFFVPKGTLHWRQPVVWLVYPLLYGIYTLIRGALGARYPYPFLDVRALGWPAVLLNSAVLGAVFVALGLVVVMLDRTVARLRGAATVSS